MTLNHSQKPKLCRITTVPLSLAVLLRGQLRWMGQRGFDVMAVSSNGPELSKICSDENHAFSLREDVVLAISQESYIFKLEWVNDLENYLTASDIVVLPSYREGCSNLLLQAGAMCLPCIASDVRL